MINKKEIEWCIKQINESKLDVRINGEIYEFDNHLLVHTNVVNRTIDILKRILEK